jgi:hypothetical protein
MHSFARHPKDQDTSFEHTLLPLLLQTCFHQCSRASAWLAGTLELLSPLDLTIVAFSSMSMPLDVLCTISMPPDTFIFIKEGLYIYMRHVNFVLHPYLTIFPFILDCDDVIPGSHRPYETLPPTHSLWQPSRVLQLHALAFLAFITMSSQQLYSQSPMKSVHPYNAMWTALKIQLHSVALMMSSIQQLCRR